MRPPAKTLILTLVLKAFLLVLATPVFGQCLPEGDPPGPCYYWNESTCSWASAAWDTPPPCHYWDESYCAWVPVDTTCPPGEVWDWSYCSCMPCQEPPNPGGCVTYNSATCTWEPIDTYCPPGYTWDPVACYCVPCQPSGSPGGCYIWNTSTCSFDEMDTTCSSGQIWDSNICGCVDQCPSPLYGPPSWGCYAWDTTSCEWISAEAPPQPEGCFFFEPSNCSWVSMLTDCDPGYLWNAAVCQCEPDLGDTDQDGMSNYYENLNGLNAAVADGGWDLDGDDIPNGEDARPNDPAVGRLTVSITTPQHNSTVQ